MPHPVDSHIGPPAPLTTFIGRDKEIAEVSGLLASSRLLTITGAGGSGKTRFALELANRSAAAHPDRVRWVELAALGRGDLLAQHVAAELHVAETPGRSALQCVIEVMRPVRLLVLDNCEHVIEEGARLVETLLRHNEDLTILATSREAFGIEGERAWLLRGLRLETHADQNARATHSEAFRFFLDRARCASASFQLTAGNVPAIESICRRLDGLPLAIELAAARVSVLTAEQIAARLDDVFGLLTSRSRTALPRHKTLRATIEWSYALVAPVERMLFQRLAVFAGSFSLEAVESICSDETLERDELLDVLAGLVTRSLVAVHEDNGTARYSLLEVMRQYAAEQLAALPGESYRQQRRHALYYAAMAEKARPHLERRRSDSLTAELAAEQANLRAALQWSFTEGDRALGIRLAAALLPFFGWSEAQVWLVEALKAPEPEESAEWGQVLYGAGFLECVRGDRRRGRELLERAAGVLERTGDCTHEVITRTSLARLLCGEDQLDAALECAERAAAVARTIQDPWPLCQAMSNGLAYAHMRLGNYDVAEACLREAFDRVRSEGANHLGIVAVTRTRAAVALERGDMPGSVEHSLAAVAAIENLQDPYQAMRVLLLLERVLCRLGRHREAARINGTICAVHADGIPGLPDELWQHRQTASLLCNSLGQSVFDSESATGEQTSIAEALKSAAAHLAATGTTASEMPLAQLARPATEHAYHLHVRALGGIDLVQEDSPHSSAGVVHARARELLVYMLCHPQGQTREQIGLAFWPDAASTQVKNSFHVLLHKLRRSLGRSDIIVAAADRYRINPAVPVWFDVAEFEREVRNGLRDLRAGRRPAGLAAALGLYQGDFLEGTAAGDWALEIEERLRRLYLDGLSALADLRINEGNLSAAVDTLEQLLRKDELREEACRRLMSCLARSGRREQALTHYRRFLDRLRDELGARPQPATVALARRLSSGE